MAKKRVHELAKELGLDNKVMLEKLAGWGFEVKGVASTLDDDQVRSVTDKLAAEKRPPSAPKSGMVIRRPKANVVPVDVQAAEAATPAPAVDEAPAPPAEPTPEEAPAPEPVAAVVAAPAPEAVAEPLAAAAAAPVAPPAEAPTAPAAPAAPAGVVHRRPAGAVSSTAHALAAGPAATRSGLPQNVPHNRASNAASGAVPVAGIDRPLRDDEEVRLINGKPHIVKKGGTELGKPTQSQAVLISRPVFIEKRATQATQNKDNIPMAPGIRPGSLAVREVQVVNEGGRARDLIEVGKRGAKKPGAARNEKAENYSKQDLIDLVRLRSYVPVIGRKKRPTKKGKKTEITEMKASKKVIDIEESITVRELSERMGVKSNDLIRKLMASAAGKVVTINQPVDFDTAEIIASDYGWSVRRRTFEISDFVPQVEDKPEQLKARPPVVTVMGHVDHGKTSLLDALRQANVAEGEAGGITQHIGAYSVTLPGKGTVTFLDTPGHEAFSAMRARGAQATDLVILVVAVDDGVQPQTVESIKHAKEAGVPIVVAINKIDKPGANTDKIKGDLASQGLQPEDWGGDVPMLPVSARQKTNLDLLLENVLLQAEILELQSNPVKSASGLVIESKLEKGRGPVATVLVQDGTLKAGDTVIAGTVFGRVRTMTDHLGKKQDKVTAGYAVQVVGLNGTPDAGEEFHVVPDEQVAKKISDHRIMKAREGELAKSAKLTVEDLLKKTAADAPKELVLVVKADVQGSVEAIVESLQRLSGKKVVNKVVAKGVGNVTESDVQMARASKAMILGFNSKPDANAAALASQDNVKVKTFDIIYALLDDVKLEMENLLEPIYREKPIGRAEVRQVFAVSKVGQIAGCLVVEGKVTRGANVRVTREKKVVHTGKLLNLKRFKDDVKEVVAGTECGISIVDYNEVQAGDVLDLFEIETLRPKLD